MITEIETDAERIKDEEDLPVRNTINYTFEDGRVNLEIYLHLFEEPLPAIISTGGAFVLSSGQIRSQRR